MEPSNFSDRFVDKTLSNSNSRSYLPRKRDGDVTIVLVEDDDQLRKAWGDFLKREGYSVVLAANGERGLTAATRTQPDLVILDWMLPDLEGTQICAQLRERRVTCPIVMLTCMDTVECVVKGLEYGADDYWIKPMAFKEARARIAALLRRNTREVESDRYVVISGLEVDLEGQRVKKDGVEVELNTKEFGILERLIGARGGVVSRDQLLASVWQYDAIMETRTVDNYILSLRRKIESDPANPAFIQTVRGKGYRFWNE